MISFDNISKRNFPIRTQCGRTLNACCVTNVGKAHKVIFGEKECRTLCKHDNDDINKKTQIMSIRMPLLSVLYKCEIFSFNLDSKTTLQGLQTN